MQQDSHVPLNVPAATLTRIRKTGRILLPLAVTVAITWLGVVVFFELVAALLT